MNRKSRSAETPTLSALGVETERLPTVPAVNQVQLTRRARTEEPSTDQELEEEMIRLVHAVLQTIAAQEDDGTARRGCCAILGFLAKSKENRLLLAQVPGFGQVVASVLRPRAPPVLEDEDDDQNLQIGFRRRHDRRAQPPEPGRSPMPQPASHGSGPPA